MDPKNNKFTEEELKKRLTPLQYQVTQEKATERPYKGEYDKFFNDGIYKCIVCDEQLFKSEQKFDSGCGWPAFYDGNKERIKEIVDKSHGMSRIEVVCSNCNAHLGHVFSDGPKPTGIRYCINSASLQFEKKPKFKFSSQKEFRNSEIIMRFIRSNKKKCLIF